MNVYIRSRGFEQNNDYRWLKVTEKEHQRVNGLPSFFQNDSVNLIYSESPSIVLSRRNGLLLLLITAIRPEGRIDFSNRQVRISVAWIAEDFAPTEKVFRLLAAHALNEDNLLIEEVIEAVTFGGTEGFQGDFEKLLRIADPNKVDEEIQNQPLTPSQELNRLAKLSPDMKNLLAQEIREFCLPKREGVLIVSTGIKKEETLREAEVWRGLSSLIHSENKWWIYYPIPDIYPFAETTDNSWESLEFKFRIKFLQFILNMTNLWERWFINLLESQVNMKTQERR